MTYKSYLKEYEEYRQNIMSDTPKSTDTFMYSNAKAIDIYAHGKSFKIQDNLKLYEVVKIVRDSIDRHYYQCQIGMRIDVGNKKAVFHFFFNKKDREYYYISGTLNQFISTQLFKVYGNYFKVTSEEKNLENSDVELEVTVEINEEI
jgi:hypothetical protein